MARTRTHPFIRMLILIVAMAAALIAVPFVMPRISNAFLYPISHESDIAASSERHGVDPYLVCAVISCESGWDEHAISDAGAEGLMQIMPETAQTMVNFDLVDPARFPVDDLATPATNIEYGCAYLGYLSRELETTEQVIAAYNAGLTPVHLWIAAGGDFMDAIEYQETRVYVTRVLVSYEGYKASYPEILSE